MKKLIILSISLLFICINNLYSQGVTIDQEGTVPDCVDTLYDSGGPSGDYGNNQDYTITISPTNASTVSISFISSLNIENHDHLYVYDGDNTGETEIYNITNTNTLPADWTSSGSSITLKFTSNAGTVGTGFAMAWQGHTQVSGTTTTTDVTCNGNYNGEIDLDVSGTTPISYEWTGPDSYSSTSQNINTLQAGEYYITATDYNGCFVSDSFNINQEPALTINFAKTNVTCNGEDDGTITVTPGGGTETTYSYSWEKDGTPIAPTTPTINNLAPGVYAVTVTDVGASSCTIIDSATITEPPALTLFNVTGTGAYCAGSSGITVSLSGSETGVNYQLKKGGVDEGTPVVGTGSPLSWDSQTQGTYTVEATNATTSCTRAMSGSANVTENPLPTAYNVTGTGSYCAGSSGVTVGLSNSQTGVNYQLLIDGSNEGAPLAGTDGSPLSWNNKAEGTYTVEATNATTSCTQTMTDNANVTEDPLPTVYNVTGTGAYCEGSSGVTVGLDGSETGVNYQLKIGGVDDGGVVAGTGSPLSWNNKTQGNYTVEATNATTSCIQAMSGNANVTENPLPIVNITNLAETYSYTDDPVKLIGNHHPEGTFSGQGVTPSDSTFHPNLADTISPNKVMYSYTDVNGCTNVDTNLVSVVTSGGKIDSLEAIYCYTNHNYNIFGTNPNDSIGSFTISGGVGLHDNGDNSAYINPSLIGPGTDTITYTYFDGANFDVVRTFTVDSVGDVDFDMNTQYCEGDNAIVLTPADVVQGVGFYPSGGNGTWSGALTPLLTPNAVNGQTAQLDPNQAVYGTTYDIAFYYTSPNGCKSNTATKSVTVNSKPNVSFTLLNYYNYEGEAVTLHGKVDGAVKPGLFNGPGITNDSIFNPNYAGIGDGKIINYEYTNPTTACSNNVNDTTNIRAANETIPELKSTYCYQDTSFTISCSPIDFSDTIGVFTSYKNAITDSDPNDNQAEYNLVTAGNGRDTVTYTYYFGDTRFDVKQIVYVDSIGNVDFITLDTSYCVSNDVVNLNAIYSHPDGYGAFTNTITGLYNNGNTANLNLDEIPADSNYVINYTYTSNISGCQSSVDKGVRINSVPVVSFDLLSNYNVNSDPVELISILNGDTTLDGTFSGPGIYQHSFDPELAGVRSNANISYTYDDTITGCSSSISHLTNIIAANASISGANDNNIYCYYEAVDTLYGTNNDGVPNSGNFTGKGIFNLSPDTATYNPVSAGSGNDTIRYNYISADDGTTILYVEKILKVDSIGEVLIFDLDTAYCSDGERVIISGFPENNNGHFTGDGITDNGDGTAYFYPNLTVPDNSYTIQYLYSSPAPSTCYKEIVQSVKINSLPVVSFTLEDNYNKDGAAIPLVGNHSQGSFSGTGVSENIFFPNLISAGSQVVINYQYTDTITGCSNDTSINTQVRIAQGDISNLSSTICYQDTVIEIAGDDEGLPGFGTFTDIRGGITDNGDNTASFNVVNAGDGNDTVVFTYYRNATKYEIIKPIIIDSIGIIDFATLDTTYCFGDPVISLKSSVYHPGTGHFSGYSGGGFIDYGNSATIDPGVIPNGSYNVKYVFTSSLGEGICKDSISKPVTFYPLPDVSFSMRDIYNIEETKDTLIASPSGGIFSGTGISGNYFLPDQSGLGSEFKITYTYTDNHSCSNSISDTTSVKQASGNIESSGDIFCYDDKVDVFVGKPENAIDGGFFIGEGIKNIATDTAQFNPAEAGSGDHNIRYQYKMKGDKDTAVFYLDKTITVDSIGFVDFTNLDNNYCHDASITELTGVPKSANGSFYGNGIVDKGDGSANFSPNDADIGENTIRYRYTNSNTGCWVDVYKNVIINEVPDIDFTINDACIADSIRFTFVSSLPLDSIMSASWIFGDGGTDTRLNPRHFYTSPAAQNINLTATTFAGCTNTKDSLIVFGIPPVADFSWKNVCFGGDSVMFVNNTPGSSNNYYWDFGDDNHSSYGNPKHSYSSIGDYNVKLIVTTDNSCNDTIVQKIHIRPYIKFDEFPSYTENFNSGKKGWYSQYRDVSNSSWQFGILQGNIINSNDEDSVWCTNLSGNYNDNEKSNITSPCFDFTALKRPMIKMKVFSNSQLKYDGTVLQYSLDDSSWTNIGTLGDGINWFNTSGIASNPGDQKLYQEGWSGDNDSAWVEIRHDIDTLKNKKNVRFRIAFASDASNSDYEGFAFDDVWIGERSRKVLLEHFTNSSSTKCNTINSQINSIVEKNASDVVDIQYHTAYPGEDLMNVYNPAAPSARSIYYGVSGVPYSIIDGKLTYDYLPASLSEKSIKQRSLVSPEFDIDLQTEKSNNSVSVSAIITALDTMENKNVSLYLAAVEKEIAIEGKSIKFKNVLRKMLPNSGGINYSRNWLPGNSETVNKSWQIDDDVNIENVIVVAFVQDDNSKVIYQAATDDTTTSSTGIASFFANNKDFNFMLYPNPSVGETYILFNKSLENDIYIQIYNQLGRVVKSVKIKKGNEMFVFNSSTYPEGMYFVRINDKKSFITKKFIVVK